MKYIVICFALFGCVDRVTDLANNTESKMWYTKDSRTNLCYSMTRSYNRDGSILSVSNVPCNPQVESLVEALRKRAE